MSIFQKNSSVPLKRMVEPYIWNSLKQNYCQQMRNNVYKYVMGNWAETNLCQLVFFFASETNWKKNFYFTYIRLRTSACELMNELYSLTIFQYEWNQFKGKQNSMGILTFRNLKWISKLQISLLKFSFKISFSFLGCASEVLKMQ